MSIATLPLIADAAGVRFRVRAVPRARRQGLVGRYGDALRVAVRAAAEKGRANEALIEVLAGVFAVPASAVQIVAGAGGRDKTVAIAGLGADAARSRLAELAAPAGAVADRAARAAQGCAVGGR